MNAPALIIQLLGAFEVWVNGVPTPRLRTRKGQSLLTHLILKHPAPVQRDWLAAVLWSDSLEEQGRLSLRQSLNDLRKALGEEGERILAPTSRTLSLDLDEAQVDVIQFMQRLFAAPHRTPSDLLSGISLYTGHLLGGTTEESLQKPMEELKQILLSAIDEVTPHLLQTEQLDTLLPILRKGILYDPLKESFVRNLMLTLAKQDDFAEVIQVYRDLRIHLEQSLRVSPSPETTALYQRLKESSQQRRTEAATSYAATPSTAAPQETPARTAHTLSRPLIQLIGREAELAELRRLILSHPLVTVLGMGGIGKTRLAHQAAYSLQSEEGERFGGGIWQVNLASLSAPDLIPVTLLSAMGRKLSPNRSIEEELLSALKDKSVLLLLDNCEHLISPLAEWVTWLLESCPELHILTTSRENFAITGEMTCPLAPLTLPKLTDDFTTVAHSPAIALWLERARQHCPGFELNTENIELVSSICRHLDGIPLAIELAAARLKLLDLPQIEERMSDRFRLLVGGSRTSLPHHKTLRAAIDGSYDLLSEEERVLFRRMSVFRGGATLEALEAVCGVEDVLSPLSRLIDRSLVLADEEVNDERRYRMLETLREYALEHLEEANERQEFTDRHFLWCLKLVQTGQPKLQSSEASHWLARFEAEHGNLRFAIQNAPSNSQKYRLIEGLVRFWHFRGYLYEGQRWVEQALENQNGIEDNLLSAVLNGAGLLCMLNTDYSKAMRYFERCVELCNETGKNDILALVYNNMGNTLSDLRDPDKAHQHYNRAIEFARQNNQQDVLARVLSNLGGLATEAGSFEEGLRYYEESSEIRKRLNDVRGVAFIDMCIGASEHGRQRYPQGFGYYKKALLGYQKLSDLYNIFQCVNYCTYLIAEANRSETAVSLLSAIDSLLVRYEIKIPVSTYNDSKREVAVTSQRITEARLAELKSAGSVWTLEEAIAHIFSEVVS